MNQEKLRQDFPVLREKEVIYFDNACMTFRPDQVIEAVNSYYKEFPSCTGRSAHSLAAKASEEYDRARKKVSGFVGAGSPNEIVFLRNTTEAINLVANCLGLEEENKVLTSDREHNSNLIPWQTSEAEHVVVGSDKEERFDLEEFDRELDEDVELVSIVHKSNLDGYSLPLKEIVERAHEKNALVLVDAAQSVGHEPVDVKDLDVDFMAFSGHKMCGPSGIGALYGKKHLLEDLDPWIVGGSTVKNSHYDSFDLEEVPEKFEAGLQNVAGAIGFGRACEYLESIGRDDICEHEKKLTSLLLDGLRELDGIDLIGVNSPEASGIVSFSVEGLDSHEVAMFLDETGNVAVRSGMHCLHSWFNERDLSGSARASVYLYNTEEEVEKFLENVEDVAHYLA